LRHGTRWAGAGARSSVAEASTPRSTADGLDHPGVGQSKGPLRLASFPKTSRRRTISPRQLCVGDTGGEHPDPGLKRGGTRRACPSTKAECAHRPGPPHRHVQASGRGQGSRGPSSRTCGGRTSVKAAGHWLARAAPPGTVLPWGEHARSRWFIAASSPLPADLPQTERASATARSSALGRPARAPVKMQCLGPTRSAVASCTRRATPPSPSTVWTGSARTCAMPASARLATFARIFQTRTSRTAPPSDRRAARGPAPASPSTSASASTSTTASCPRLASRAAREVHAADVDPLPRVFGSPLGPFLSHRRRKRDPEEQSFR
jgi:hypothetical protein